MTKYYTVVVRVASPYTEWYMKQNPSAVEDAFAKLQTSDLGMDLGENGSTPTFEIIDFVSIKEDYK